MSRMKRNIMTATIVLVMFLLVTMVSTVKATDSSPIDISGNLDITTGNTDTSTNTTQNEDITPSINTTSNSEVIQPVTNTTENTTERLPQTGVTEDITVMFFIVVCAVSAVYAYKKIRDYNV